MIEEHGTQGAYNIFGYINHDINNDVNRDIYKDIRNINKNKIGGIIVFESGDSEKLEAIIKASSYVKDKVYAIRHCLKHNYMLGGCIFDENSLCLEILDVNKKDLMSLASSLMKELHVNKSIIKYYNDRLILTLSERKII